MTDLHHLGRWMVQNGVLPADCLDAAALVLSGRKNATQADSVRVNIYQSAARQLRSTLESVQVDEIEVRKEK